MSTYVNWREEFTHHIAKAFQITHVEASEYVYICGDDELFDKYKSGVTPKDAADQEVGEVGLLIVNYDF